MNFKIGDNVYVNDSAQDDVCLLAWDYIKRTRVGRVCGILDPETKEDFRQYAILFSDVFEGGHTCKDSCPPNRGQFITAMHLQLVENYA